MAENTIRKSLIESVQTANKNISQKVTLNPNNTFFIADFHFDHKNIIQYCNRPFQTVEEMNEVMLRNYNETVEDDSTVYFLGDMAFGRDSRTPKHWLSQLRGHITYIKGSHDHGLRPTNLENCYERLELDTEQSKVLLMHKPYDRQDWKGWIIHGHTHSTHMISTKYRSVCAGVEAINYKPVSLQQIHEAIQNSCHDVRS